MLNLEIISCRLPIPSEAYPVGLHHCQFIVGEETFSLKFKIQADGIKKENLVLVSPRG
jgi:hypothetical protein